MKKKFKNFNQFDKRTNLIFSGTLLSLLFIMTLAYYQHKKSFFELKNSFLLLAGFILSISSLIAMSYLYKSTKKSIQKKDKLPGKLALYYQTFIIKLAFLWISGVANSLFYYMTANKIFIVFSAFSVLAILMARPYADKLSKEFNASDIEKRYFDNPDKSI